MHHLAIFASGTGTNARAIIQYFSKNPEVTIAAIICNNPKAGVREVAKNLDVPFYLVTRKDFYESNDTPELLKALNVDLIILAGFLWLIPENLLHAFPGRIINIHPALLPAHGGKGMYGTKVHAAVLAANDKETGITIHYLNENYDEGKIIFQQKVPVEPGDTIESIAQKVHVLEHEWYPKIIERMLFQSGPV